MSTICKPSSFHVIYLSSVPRLTARQGNERQGSEARAHGVRPMSRCRRLPNTKCRCEADFSSISHRLFIVFSSFFIMFLSLSLHSHGWKRRARCLKQVDSAGATNGGALHRSVAPEAREVALIEDLQGRPWLLALSSLASLRDMLTYTLTSIYIII